MVAATGRVGSMLHDRRGGCHAHAEGDGGAVLIWDWYHCRSSHSAVWTLSKHSPFRPISGHSPNARTVPQSLIPALAMKCVFYATTWDWMASNVNMTVYEILATPPPHVKKGSGAEELRGRGHETWPASSAGADTGHWLDRVPKKPPEGTGRPASAGRWAAPAVHQPAAVGG